MPTKLADTSLYSVSELAQKLNVTTTTVRNYIKAGHLKAKKITGRWLIAEDDLKKFLNSL